MSIRAGDKTPAREEIELKVSERDFLKELLLQVGERLEEVEEQIKAHNLYRYNWEESSPCKGIGDASSGMCQGQCEEHGTTCAKVMGHTPNFPFGAPRDGQLHCDCQRWSRARAEAPARMGNSKFRSHRDHLQKAKGGVRQ